MSRKLYAVTHIEGVNVRTRLQRRDRAHRRSCWATRRTPSRVLAAHWGVSASRARHLRTDDPKGALTTVLAMVADPEVDAGPIVAAVLSGFEERFLFSPTTDLRARLARLRDRDEHLLEAAQNRATVVRSPKRAEDYLAHATALIEMAVLVEILEPEELAH